MYAITAASGQLGRLVVENLLKSAAPGEIVAVVRNPAKVDDLAALGVQVRRADYDEPASLAAAFTGIDKLLLISSSEVTGRVPQHRAVIEAARGAGVKLLAYTSMLRADRSPAHLAEEHRDTEALLAASGLATVVLRNGWYTENYLMALQPVVEHGAMVGSARQGRISLAARADYAAAAARVLTSEGHAGQVYELAGDTAWTLSDFAAEIGRQAGRAIAYRNLPQADYEAVLVGAGMPTNLAGLLADADARAADGALFEDGHALSRLIGRATTPVPETIAAALRG